MFETADTVIAVETSVIIAIVLYWLLSTPDPQQSRKQFLKKYKEKTIDGWKQIYEHLDRMCKICGTDEVHGKDNCVKWYTRIEYKSLSIKILGSLTVDQTLMILSEWEVSYSSVCVCGHSVANVHVSHSR